MKKRSLGSEDQMEKIFKDDAKEFWEIGKKRRVTISQFGNRKLVDIREYYEDNGEMKPGKRGISLTIDQFNEFVKVIGEIQEKL